MNNNEFPPISKNVADMTLYVQKKKKNCGYGLNHNPINTKIKGNQFEA